MIDLAELQAKGEPFTSDSGLVYRVRRLLEEGGESRVFLVEGEDRKHYAAKQFIETKKFEVPTRIRFEAERAILTELSQANDGQGIHGVVALRDTGEVNKVLVLDYVGRDNLRIALEARGCLLDPVDDITIIGSVSSTLDEMLNWAITYFDLKPENIALSETATNYLVLNGHSGLTLQEVIKPRFIQLIDFSNACKDGKSQVHQKAWRRGVYIGTRPYYVTGQEKMGDDGKFERKQGARDIFSLGILAYELFQGLGYFDGYEDIGPFREFFVMIRKDGPPRLVGATRRQLGDFEDVIYAMVDADPMKRPTAKQVYEASRDFLARRGVDLDAALHYKRTQANTPKQPVLVTN